MASGLAVPQSEQRAFFTMLRRVALVIFISFPFVTTILAWGSDTTLAGSGGAAIAGLLHLEHLRLGEATDLASEGLSNLSHFFHFLSFYAFSLHGGSDID